MRRLYHTFQDVCVDRQGDLQFLFGVAEIPHGVRYLVFELILLAFASLRDHVQDMHRESVVCHAGDASTPLVRAWREIFHVRCEKLVERDWEYLGYSRFRVLRIKYLSDSLESANTKSCTTSSLTPEEPTHHSNEVCDTIPHHLYFRKISTEHLELRGCRSSLGILL